MKIIQQQLCIDEEGHGLRLDQALSIYFPDFSRSKIQDWIKQGFILLNQSAARSKDKVYKGDQVKLDVPETPQTFDRPEKVAFDRVYQDEHLIIINKPAGLVVHPAAGHASGTLVNGLLYQDPALEQLPRAGIVHRLDKDTTGVMVVARSLQAHTALVDALQKRSIKREYVAVVKGLITAGRSIDAPIARHPIDRKRMAVKAGGREAVTHFTVREKYRAHCLIDVQLETGRTHQIRVHMAHIHHPLLGDPVYGGRLTLPAGISAQLEQVIRHFKRQALHAWRLSFIHPITGKDLSFTAEIPSDLRSLITALQQDAK
ncbi:MAG: 23S rRNA pseudouridine(1911/1915/1917) synthase RluD [Gammaproteobacteria bacterium]|nr:23S rRNA pseudouridine(1911/1915/1917) synthase RluD [Gammaproteobacteria bacterium]